MTESMLGDVARQKEALLRVPVVAHSKAAGFYQQAMDRNDKDAIEVWEQVLRELTAEGYAPTESGQDGPAVKAHYQGGVLRAQSPPDCSLSAAEVESLAADPYYPLRPAIQEPPL